MLKSLGCQNQEAKACRLARFELSTTHGQMVPRESVLTSHLQESGGSR